MQMYIRFTVNVTAVQKFTVMFRHCLPMLCCILLTNEKSVVTTRFFVHFHELNIFDSNLCSEKINYSFDIFYVISDISWIFFNTVFQLKIFLYFVLFDVLSF